MALNDVRWKPCPKCSDYLCTVHGMHAHDCACPNADELPKSPYPVGLAAVPTFQLLQWKHAIMLEKQWNHGGRKAFRRSVRVFAAKAANVGPRTKHEVMVGLIEKELALRNEEMVQ